MTLAQDSYPKKLIIQNSKSKDTVICYTNEQVIKINQEHVILKQCVEYSNIQDSTILFLSKTIEELKSANSSYISLDSISRETIDTQNFMLQSSYKEKKQLEESFIKYKKDVKKDKIKSWLYSNLIITPIIVITTALTVKFTK